MRALGLMGAARSRAVVLVVLAVAAPGCSWLARGERRRTSRALAAAILDHPDPETVEQGAPACLLMVDGLIQAEPGNRELLRTGAELYTAYAAAFLDPESPRAARLTGRALAYAFRALGPGDALRTMAFEDFEARLATLARRDVPALYALGTAWAGWILSRGEDLEAVAELGRVEAIMARVVALDEGYRDGGAHLSLGVLRAAFPEGLGGRPDEGRKHFLRAIDLAGGRDAMHKVLFAQHYARQVFDRALHDRLLREVLARGDDAPGHALANALARRKAKDLLDSADVWFGGSRRERDR